MVKVNLNWLFKMKKQEEDNAILIGLAKADQSDRALLRLGKITFETLKKNDEERLEKVEKDIELDKIKTSQDCRNAGLIFHHSRIKNKHCRSQAVKFLQKSAELDNYGSIGIKWLLAATIDRGLMQENKPQIYGTQYVQNEQGHHELYKLDDTQISDIERKEHGVTIVADQAAVVENMNRKQLIDIYAQNGSIEEIKLFCKKNHKTSNSCDLSWKGISQFGFHLKRAGQIENALQIFELAIKLYPKEYDLYHSLGLLYGEIGKTEKAIELIEKCLALNPIFQDGIIDLKRLREKRA